MFKSFPFFYDTLNDEEEKVFAYKEGKKCQTVSIPSTRALQTQSGSHVRFFLPAHLDAVNGVEQAHKRAYRGLLLLVTFSPAFKRIRRPDLVLTLSIDFSCSPGKKPCESACLLETNFTLTNANKNVNSLGVG